MPFQIEWIDTNDHGWYIYNREEYNSNMCHSQLIVHYVQDQEWANVDSTGNLNFCK